MKKSIIFKTISFICIPIFIIAVVLSTFAAYVKNGTNYNENKYYASYSFATSYMSDLSDACDDLIYKNENYYNLNDGENTIYYTNRQLHSSNVKDFKYIIIYKNKAITNIDTGKELNTIEDIKAYVKGIEDYEKVNIVNGITESSNDTIKKINSNYYGIFTKTYYTKQDDKTIYYTTKYTDFEIYSAY